MSDIITRLLLNTNDFETKLGRSKKEVNEFEVGLKNAGKNIGSAMKGVAGAVGVAFGAMEVFDRMIKSSEANNDAWENSMRAVSNVTNEFFSSLTSGDFTVLYTGLDNIIQKARDTAEALRQIDDAQTAFGYTSSKNRADFNEFVVTMRDVNASPEERLKAKQGAQEIVEQQRSESESLAAKALNAATSLLTQRSVLSAGSISELDIEKTLRLALSAEAGDKIESLEEQYEEYLKEIEGIRDQFTEVVKLANGMDTKIFQGKDNPMYEKRISETNDKYTEALMYHAMFNGGTNGDDLKMLVSFLQQAQGARGEVASMEKTLIRAGSSVKEGPAEGSIAYLQEKLKELDKQLINAVNEEARAAARTSIAAIEAQIKTMKEGTSGKVREDLLGDKLPSLPGIEAPEATSLSSPGLAIPEEGDITNINSAAEGMNSTFEKTGAIIGALSSTMGAFSGIIDDETQAWLSYGQNIVSAVGTAIPAIGALVDARRTEATANTAAAATGAGGAVASIPFVGPAMAVAAIASVIAAIAAIPKFATGGIVPGNSYFGDNVLARVNSGEMILNRDQQARLLNNIERPSQNIRLSGKLTASGRDLAWVLKDYEMYRRQ